MTTLDLFQFWPYLVSMFCAVLLGSVIVALISSPAFRKDLAASEGKANLFNQISIEGALVLILCSLFFYGLIFPVRNPYVPFSKMAKAQGIDAETPEVLIGIIQSKQLELDNSNQVIQDLRRSISDSESINEDKISEDKIPEYIRQLPPNHTISQAIYDYPKKQIGPWGQFHNSEIISVSIPSTDIEPGKAFVCQERFGQSYELLSALKIDDKLIDNGEQITVEAIGYIYRSTDCSERVSYQMQISCVDAMKLFTNNVMTCNENNEARWINQKPEKLLVSIVPTPAEQVDDIAVGE